MGKPRAYRPFGTFIRIDLSGDDGASRRRTAETVFAYRIERLTGSVTTDFRGLPDPACQVLGACGLAGRTSFEVAGPRGVLLVGGVRYVGPRATKAKELRALRHGRYETLGYGQLSRTSRAKLSAQVSGSAGTACSDARLARLPPVGVSVEDRSVHVALGGAEEQSLFGSDDAPDDPFRTRCAGPATQDVFGSRPFARGAFALSALGRRRLPLALDGTRRFTGAGWGGQARAALTSQLRLVGVQVRFRPRRPR
jgi:hypothetical protein